MKFEPKKKVSLADTKRALHQVMQQDGLAFPDTPEDIDRVRAAYLTPRNRTVGLYLPDGHAAAADDDEPAEMDE